MIVVYGANIAENINVIQKLPNHPNAEWEIEDLTLHDAAHG